MRACTAWTICTVGLLLLMGVSAPFVVEAEPAIDIRVQGSAGRDLRVAVQRFASDDFAMAFAAPFDNDLNTALAIAASFEIVDPAAFLEPRETVDYDEEAIVCDNWRGIGADILVQGRLERRRDSVRVRYRIWDVGRCRMQGRAGYIDAPPDRVWVAARRLADEIALRFTGRRGSSSTQIAFVSDKTGNKEVYLMEADGSRLRAVTHNGRINLLLGIGACLEFDAATMRRAETRSQGI